MIKQFLIKRIKFWIKKYKTCKNEMIKTSIDLVLTEKLKEAEYYYNQHYIGIHTYLYIKDLIDNKDK